MISFFLYSVLISYFMYVQCKHLQHGIEVVYQNLYILRHVVKSVHDLVPANLFVWSIYIKYQKFNILQLKAIIKYHVVFCLSAF